MTFEKYEINAEAIVRRLVFEYNNWRDSSKGDEDRGLKRSSVAKAHAHGRYLGACEIVAHVFRLSTPAGVDMDLRDVVRNQGDRPAYNAGNNNDQKAYDEYTVRRLMHTWCG